MRGRASIVVVVAVLFPWPVLAQKEFGFDNRKPSGQPYLPPAETVKRMKVADGWEVKLSASEPAIVNPIAFTFDEKGRIWMIESFEYPKRTPKGKAPRDRIKILESTKGDGVYDKVTIFAEGKDFPVPKERANAGLGAFDMASGIEVGYGGVFVGAAPYLWFIENKNDKPGKFEVLLKGFGSQDTHEVLNTFQWGPDGWLYGLQGVFTNSDVAVNEPEASATDGRPVAHASGSSKLNAGVWRYKPAPLAPSGGEGKGVRGKFEIFAEGTSNPWGMDWRNSDGQFILCCCVIPHLYHIIPGGIYKRQAGSSFNPYAYGQINEICDHTFHKESGWAHAGLICLDAPHLPKEYHDRVIFGSIHGCSIKQNILKKNGSTFTASRADDFLVSGDKNFRPINLRWGPDGAIYIIDWHDQNPCHQAAPDSWDYEHGRIYRLAPKDLERVKAEDLGALGAEAFFAKMADPNPYVSRQALRLTYERCADKPVPAVNTPKIRRWEDLRALNALGDPLKFEPGIVQGDASLAVAWLARFAADRGNVTDAEIEAMAGVVVWYPDSTVRSDPSIRRELASAAVRLAGNNRNVSHLLHQLMWNPDDAADPVIPHLVWLAYEKMLAGATGAALDAELTWLADEARPKVLTPDRIVVNYMVMDYIVPRVMRRLASTGRQEDLARCVAFLGKVDDAYVFVRRKALEGLALALQGRTVDAPPQWKALSAVLEADPNPDVKKLARQLAVSFKDLGAARAQLTVAKDATKPLSERIDALRSLALVPLDEAFPVLLQFIKSESPPEIRQEALRALAGYDRKEIPGELLGNWPKLSPPLRAEAANILAGRKEWAKQLLDAVGSKKVDRRDLTDNTILRIRAFKDKNLDAQIQTVWGKFRDTPAELNKLIDKMRLEMYQGNASFAKGKLVFENTCAKCHHFEGKGADVGPALDGAARDIEYLLINIIDPNRVIGAPYFIRTVELKNGRSEIGLLAAEDAQTVTLKVENGVQKVIAKKDIENITVQEKSMMPEGLDKNLSLQDFRDLIRYVMANPFITDVKIDGKPMRFGPAGRITLPTKDRGEAKIEAEITSGSKVKTRLLLGGNAELAVKLNDKQIYKGKLATDQPDQASVEIELSEGVNKLVLEAKFPGGKAALFARFLDPDRKLRNGE
ncbi:MAG TPA: PVC-type heme-binding CxxCH protein [Gemmataceae bacterium]|jgi:putative membrane-bound dehydrogenase-like protein|nr:PVC-type heme-binding CxxCH protein [Gemmataceae bacterium]